MSITIKESREVDMTEPIRVKKRVPAYFSDCDLPTWEFKDVEELKQSPHFDAWTKDPGFRYLCKSTHRSFMSDKPVIYLMVQNEVTHWVIGFIESGDVSALPEWRNKEYENDRTN